MSYTVSSSALALLDERDVYLQVEALEQLNDTVGQYWAEFADSVSRIEELYEDTNFPKRELAALVASKIHYNLGELQTSMQFALGAGKLFNINKPSEYVETIISECIDTYKAIAQNLNDNPNAKNPEQVDPRLRLIIEQILQNAIEAREFKLVIGIAIESRRIDILSRCVRLALSQKLQSKKKSNSKSKSDFISDFKFPTDWNDVIDKNDPNSPELNLITYIYNCCMNSVTNLQFRNKILYQLVSIIFELSYPDYYTVSKILMHLNDTDETANILNSLIDNHKIPGSTLTAFQIAFDLASSASQDFLQKLSEKIKPTAKDSKKLISILSGIPTCDIEVTFLHNHNNTDLQILNKTKSSLDMRSSLFHSAISFSNAFIHAGTTDDKFIRTNLEWLAKALNWSKFTATAALGVIHKGNLTQGMNILRPYLPKVSPDLAAAQSQSQSQSSTSTAYSQGGSLFALGIIFTGFGSETLSFIRQFLLESNVPATKSGEIVQHGACLGAGLAGLSSNNEDVYEELRSVLYSDSAISGEPAGLAMGLVMLGSASEIVLDEMYQYAKETQHDKIIRGIAIGMGLVMFGCQEQADSLIEKLAKEQHPILRYGSVMTIALAYCGTGNKKVIKSLLHTAVSDSNDDVRRMAVMSLGFVLFKNHEAVPRLVELLSESYNPHVRYGAALALGISCAGTGLDAAIRILEPMARDPTDFVRQGALISMAMILIQQNNSTFPRVTEIRKLFAKVVADKHEDGLARFGAAIAQGIIDAGGRNVTISLENPQTGSLNTQAIVGMVVFTQFWYWYPFAHFLSLSFSPTVVACVDESLKIPSFSFYSSCKPSLFAYPAKITEQADKAPEKVATAVLSTTAKANARAKKRKEKMEKSMMEIDEEEGEEETNDSKTTKSTKSEKIESEIKIVESKKDNNEDSLIEVDMISEVDTPNSPKEDKIEIEPVEDEKDNKTTKTTTATNTSSDKSKEKVSDKESLEKNKKDDSTPIEVDSSDKNKEDESDAAQSEPVGYRVNNLSRVMPDQLKYISFAQTDKFVPIKKSNKVNGGIIVVKATNPTEKVKYIDTIRDINAPNKKKSSPSKENCDAPVPHSFYFDAESY